MATTRVTGILVEYGKILLVKQKLIDEDREWSLPGGKLKPGETLEAAVIREVKEETGLDVAVVSLLYVAEKVDKGLLHISFSLKRISGKLEIPTNQYDTNPITDVSFIPIEELTAYGFSLRWKNLVERNFDNAPCYVGDKNNIGL